MANITLALNLIGGLALFLFGMKIMSEGIQQSAGDRLRNAINYMTGNRFVGVITGFSVTAIIQSSTAVTLMVISFANAGLITLTQSIGVIFGANIGTTLTAWIVSIVGFKINIDAFAIPAIGIGFIISMTKWKYKSLGRFTVGFGLLFLGLHYLTHEMRNVHGTINFNAISVFVDMGYLGMLAAVGVGVIMSALINSSTASIAIIMTMAYNGIVSYEMAAGMVLGTNIGTTGTAALVAIGASATAKRVALVHVLFNIIGAIWAFFLIFPLLNLVGLVIPGNPMTDISAIPVHIAGLHTIYNVVNAALFLPFVRQFAGLVSFVIRETPEEKDKHYTFAYISTAKASTPELNILRAEKEIRDMAGIASSMYGSFSALMRDLPEMENREEAAAKLCEELKHKEEYTDEMREALSAFLIECTRKQLNPRSSHRVTQLLRVIGYIEEMSDDCYLLSMLLEKSIRKNRIFKKEEMNELVPYLNQVEEFLGLLQEQLGQGPTAKLTAKSKELEANINKARKDLQKLSRKRIEAGKDVKTELFFIDLVRRIEKLGDYCYDISSALGKIDVPLYKRLFQKF